MSELVALPENEPLPSYQATAAKDLKRYRRAGWLRRALLTYRFSPGETALLVRLVQQTHVLKRRAAKAGSNE